MMRVLILCLALLATPAVAATHRAPAPCAKEICRVEEQPKAVWFWLDMMVFFEAFIWQPNIVNSFDASAATKRRDPIVTIK